MSAVARKGYLVRRAADVPPVPCPCGQAARIVTAADGARCSVHVTEIYDAERHYHKTFTEAYYILEGGGRMELDGEAFEVGPGSVVYIEPGTRHRLLSPGGVKAVIFSTPAFDPEDEHFD